MTTDIVAQLKFTDVEAYRRYQAAIPAVFGRFDGHVLAADEAPQPIEGDWPFDKIVVIGFPSEAEARRFADDPEYKAISRDRHAGAETVSLLVKGLGRRG